MFKLMGKKMYTISRLKMLFLLMHDYLTVYIFIILSSILFHVSERVVSCLGKAEAIDLTNKTRDIEDNGGMMTKVIATFESVPSIRSKSTCSSGDKNSTRSLVITSEI